jgi:hypothetical protein
MDPTYLLLFGFLGLFAFILTGRAAYSAVWRWQGRRKPFRNSEESVTRAADHPFQLLARGDDEAFTMVPEEDNEALSARCFICGLPLNEGEHSSHLPN